MLQNRVIPCLLIQDNKLVKTVKFKNPKYIGDPVNAIKIYNEKEVDELIVVDISKKRYENGPNFNLIKQMADECFMPVCYGGGISNIDQIQKILKIGIEKIALNTAIMLDTQLISQAANKFGSQCIVVALDIKKNWLGKYKVTFNSGDQMINTDIVDFAKTAENAGAGEILINNIDRDGTWEGFDIEMIRKITSNVSIPVIAAGGAGNLSHIKDAITIGKASAVVIGSMAVYQSKGMGVLINFPKTKVLEEINNL
jgi:cyclase